MPDSGRHRVVRARAAGGIQGAAGDRVRAGHPTDRFGQDHPSGGRPDAGVGRGRQHGGAAGRCTDPCPPPRERTDARAPPRHPVQRPGAGPAVGGPRRALDRPGHRPSLSRRQPHAPGRRPGPRGCPGPHRRHHRACWMPSRRVDRRSWSATRTVAASAWSWPLAIPTGWPPRGCSSRPICRCCPAHRRTARRRSAHASRRSHRMRVSAPRHSRSSSPSMDRTCCAGCPPMRVPGSSARGAAPSRTRPCWGSGPGRFATSWHRSCIGLGGRSRGPYAEVANGLAERIARCSRGTVPDPRPRRPHQSAGHRG